MKKFLTFLLVAFVYAISAEALVLQSASEALSFRNVAKSKFLLQNNKNNNNSIIRNKTETRAAQTKEIDLTSEVSQTVALLKGDSAVVTVKEDDCCKWKVKYDNSAVIFTDKGKTKGIRTFIFKQSKSDKSSTVYFDEINKADNTNIGNKALYIEGK